MSRFFGHVTKLLGIQHKTGAALNPRSNGYAEQVIKRVIKSSSGGDSRASPSPGSRTFIFFPPFTV